MDAVFLKVLNMSIAASWLILAVTAVRFCLNKAPRWIICLLWALAAVRLACPFSLESAFSLVPSAETFDAYNIWYETPEVHTGVSFINSAVNPVLAETFSPAPGDSVNPLAVWVSVAGFVWAAGIAALLLYAAVSCLRVSGTAREAVPMEGQENVYLCDAVKSPFIFGVFRPRIFLPSGIEPSDLEPVIAHERAHLARRDHWWKPLGFLILTVHWFNPLCWFSYRLLCHDIELACDEKVIRGMNFTEKKSYSAALLNCSVPRRRMIVCPLAFGEIGVKERVKNVLNYKKPAFWIVASAFIACIVVAACFLTNPPENPLTMLGPIQVQEASALNMRSDEPVTRRLTDTEISELQQHINDLRLGRAEPDFEGLTPCYSLYVQAQQAERLTFSGFDFDGNHTGMLYRGRYHRINDSSFRAYLKTICEKDGGEKPVRPLSLDDVVALSQKGDALTWSDFEGYSGKDIGFGLYVLRYEIDSLFYVLVGGVPSEKPMYIRLVVNNGNDDFVELREGDVAAFIEAHKDGVPVPATPSVPPENSEEINPEPFVPPTDGDLLDAAISEAVLAHHKDNYLSGDFACESHIVLASEGTGDARGDQIDAVTVYLWVLYQEYDCSDSGIEEISGAHIPTALTFDIDEFGKYTLKEYWEPRDGGDYPSDIRAKFPSPVAEDGIDGQKFILRQKQECYAQAVRFFHLDTNQALRGLIETITGGPLVSSSPQYYIDSWPVEYREIIYYGAYALEYCFSCFEQGGNDGLEGHIMARACADIAGGMGEKLTVRGLTPDGARTGQQWYDAFKNNALKLKNNSNEELAGQYPASWLLLRMIEEQ